MSSSKQASSSRAGRRKHARVSAPGLRAEVRSEGTELECVVDDVSRGGLFLQTEQVLALGAPVEMTLRRSSGKGSVALTGRVVRHVPGTDVLVTFRKGLGIAFEPLSDELEEALRDLLAYFGYTEAAPPPLPGPQGARIAAEPALTLPEVPVPSLSTDNDPFLERSEPRMPRGGLPDEKVEYFRQVVQLKQEALNRGRALYADAVAVADTLHGLATRFRSDLEAANAKVEQAVALQTETDALRVRTAQLEQDLAAREAEVEAAETDRADAQKRAATFESDLASQRARVVELDRARDELEDELKKIQADLNKQLEKERHARTRAEEKLTRLEGADLAARKGREELSSANRKAMEAQAALNKEHRARTELETEMHKVQRALAALTGERDALRESVATMKKKLIAAEDGLDAALSKARLQKKAERA